MEPSPATSPLSAILLIACPDRKGLVASVTDFIFRHDGNIIHLDQHVDQAANAFFMRVEWDLTHFAIAPDAIRAHFQPIAQRFGMDYALHLSHEVPRMAVFVSKQGHCLYEVLARYQSGDWRVEIPAILSNHIDMQSVAEKFGIPFYHFPILNSADKPAVEVAQLELLASLRIDFIVLARYMQIVSADFIRHYPNRIINIHHSFLPAFIGARPYHGAHARGVKIIGATSHYVTAELDAGPIIEQDVIRVDHRDAVADLIRKGKDVEKLVFARAIWYHLQRRLLVYQNKTIVFG